MQSNNTTHAEYAGVGAQGVASAGFYIRGGPETPSATLPTSSPRVRWPVATPLRSLTPSQ